MTNNNFALLHAGDAARQELHDALGLTGCEVSVNTLPAGAGIPFVHAHTKNEEVYGVLAGSGELWLDGETHPVTEFPAGSPGLEPREECGLSKFFNLGPNAAKPCT